MQCFMNPNQAYILGLKMIFLWTIQILWLVCFRRGRLPLFMTWHFMLILLHHSNTINYDLKTKMESIYTIERMIEMGFATFAFD